MSRMLECFAVGGAGTPAQAGVGGHGAGGPSGGWRWGGGGCYDRGSICMWPLIILG